MTKVKTTVEIIYDSVIQKTGYGIVQMNTWKEEVNGSFSADTEKFGMKNGVMESIPGSFKTVIITEEKYNTLVGAIKPYIPEGLTPYEEREFIKRQSFLLYVQTDMLEVDSTKCIWGLQPSQFELAE